ncbi:MAG: SpoIIE family protein phosphatase [Atopobiaceae bacterium]|nr:SpoIIE family protein phosphatase [Atopobiaceae bacterium]
MADLEGVRVVVQFAFATLLPAAVSAALTVLIRRTKLGEASYWPWQIACGVIFGLIAIMGTEMGINTHGATMNVRDAAPIVAGLYFGGPAGIIAGLIGGIERWFSVLWGRGMFTRLGCSLATALSGLYAALLNRYLFDERKPSWPMAFSIGMVAEVLHLLLIFLTNLDHAVLAYEVVRVCTIPMVTCNALAVALAGVAIALACGEGLRRERGILDISQKVQLGMLGVVVLGFFVTMGFTGLLQGNLAKSQTRETLELALSDVSDDIKDASDENLLSLTRRVASAIPSVSAASDETIQQLLESLDVSEIHVIDSHGIIAKSSEKKYEGFDMSSGEQSAAFLELLPSGRSTYLVQEYQPMAYDANVWRKYAGRRISDGFVQVGYDSTTFLDDLETQVRAAVASRHVGHEGAIVVISEDGSVAYSRKGVKLTTQTVNDLLAASDAAGEDAVFEISLNGVPCYALASSVEGYRVAALLPTEEANLAADLALLVTSFIEIVVFAAIFAAIYLLIKRVVVRSIWQVNGRLGQITGGNLNVEVDVRNSTEFASLSNDINSTVAALRDAIAAEAARINRELGYAQAIQQSALQHVFPPYPEHKEFDLFASMRAAKEVGGDFYDFYLLDDTHLAFLIADVSGKGIPAALFMMRAKTAIRSLIDTGADVDEVFTMANDQLCEGNDADMFVTAWMGVINLETGNIRFANAGHNPPAIKHDGQGFELLKMKKNLILGCMPGIRYRVSEMEMAPGDILYLYTDGVVEAMNSNDEQYGDTRLIDILNRSANLSVERLCEAVRNDVDDFAGDAPQFDDMTMLALRYKGPAPAKE